MQKQKCTAIVLAAGQGKRMGTKVQKQYLEISGKPVLFYSLDVFQKSELIDEVVLVVGKEQEEYCWKEIVEKYNMTKVSKIVEGGAERYHSVWNGLQEVEGDGYVFIHDGARPLITADIIESVKDAVELYGAAAPGVPLKDTVKIIDPSGKIIETPNRSSLVAIQTPQGFKMPLYVEALGHLEDMGITDDCQLLEKLRNA